MEDALEKAVEADSDVLGTTAGYLLAAGGKRFRPMLVLLAGYFGDPTDPRLIPGAAAIELTHVATLYHDDVMDEAASRHGVASVNARWDNTIAILTGDFLFARSSELSADLGPDVCRLLAQTIAVLCDGQIRDVASAGNVDKTEEDHLEVIRRKTGVLIATSCRMGGMLSDATPERPGDAGGLRRVARAGVPAVGRHHGHHLDPAGAGQGAGTDIREGVYTIPVLHALREGPGRDELRRILAAGPPDGELLDRALRDRPQPAAPSSTRARRWPRRSPARASWRGGCRRDMRNTRWSNWREFLGVRCGAEVGAESALLGYGRAGEGTDGM